MNDSPTAALLASLCSRIPLDGLPATLPHADRVLGTVGLGFAPPGNDNGAPAVHVAVGRLPCSAPCLEMWLGRSHARTGRRGPVDFATDGDLLFGNVRMAEGDWPDLRAAARAAFAAIFAALDESGCAHPLRIWNYVPRINSDADGLERYRQFNIGRQEAFLAAGRSAFAGAPAACALGSLAGPLSIHFLAARHAPQAVENPRQVSAYHYPTEYGPRAPTFSRAAVARVPEPVLFVSGTASIVGFRSLHAGDARAQTIETFANLRALLDAANRPLAAPAFILEALTYTVYVRHVADVGAVRDEVTRALGAHAPGSRVSYVQADICRAELLVEIEAMSDPALPA